MIGNTNNLWRSTQTPPPPFIKMVSVRSYLKRVLRNILHYICCRAPAKQHTILDDDRGFSQSSLDPVFCPDLCIVEISICVCLLRCRISGGTNSATFVEAKGLRIDKHLFCFAPHFLPFGPNVHVIKPSKHVKIR